MKHIKTFEEENITDKLIGKFVIYQTTTTTIDPETKKDYKFLYIFEILKLENNDIVTVKRHYEYDTMLNKINTINKNNSFKEVKGTLKQLLDNTLFSSDNLKECVEMLPLLSDTNKFNL